MISQLSPNCFSSNGNCLDDMRQDRRNDYNCFIISDLYMKRYFAWFMFKAVEHESIDCCMCTLMWTFFFFSLPWKIMSQYSSNQYLSGWLYLNFNVSFFQCLCYYDLSVFAWWLLHQTVHFLSYFFDLDLISKAQQEHQKCNTATCSFRGHT